MAKKTPRERVDAMRPFLIVLICTFAVWMGAAMSEEQNYTSVYEVEWSGIDTSRFVIAYADTSVEVVLRSNGFNALRRSMDDQYQHLVIDVLRSMPEQHGGKFVIRMDTRYMVQHSNQRHNVGGISSVSSKRDRLKLVLAERHFKTFKPRLKGVEYHFAPQFGVGGEPHVTPDSVMLYGSQESLDKVAELTTRSTVIANIDRSGRHRIELDSTCWQRYPDLRPSTDHVDIYVPVRRFVKKTFKVPLRVVGVESGMKVKLYPDKVQVTLLASTDDYATTHTSDIHAQVQYSDTLEDGIMQVRLAQFPSTVRIQSIEPQQVRFVVIK